MGVMRWIWWLVPLLGLGGGCSSTKDSSPSASPDWVPLIVADAWVEVTTPTDDPFSDRPEIVDCSALGYGVEGTYFEVSTDDCAYGTFQQLLQHGAEAGEDLKLVFWHLDLWAPEPAQAHLAVATADTVLYERALDIPGGSEVIAETFSSPRLLEAGEPIFFHLHNHGYNSWSLGSLEAYTIP